MKSRRKVILTTAILIREGWGKDSLSLTLRRELKPLERRVGERDRGHDIRKRGRGSSTV